MNDACLWWCKWCSLLIYIFHTISIYSSSQYFFNVSCQNLKHVLMPKCILTRSYSYFSFLPILDSFRYFELKAISSFKFHISQPQNILHLSEIAWYILCKKWSYDLSSKNASPYLDEFHRTFKPLTLLPPLRTQNYNLSASHPFPPLHTKC